MPELNIAPTRRNFLELRRTLERTREGHDLLEQKRQILVLELMTMVESAKRLKDKVKDALADGHRELRQAVMHSGASALARQNYGITMDHQVTYRPRSVMGVPVPEVECEPASLQLEFGISAGNSRSDQVMQSFLKALPLVVELARVENAVFRLAREVRRTQRRVNALEKLYIPQYKDALSRIEGVLAERQREEFIVLRKVKHKRRAAREAELAGPPAPRAPEVH